PLTQRVIRRVLTTHHRRALGERMVHNELSSILADLSPDVVNVHNLHKASDQSWSAELVTTCAKHAPTVWTLHDMWSFTGRCAYSYECKKYLTGCDSGCPTPEEHPPLAPERIAEAWNNRRRQLRERPTLVAVAPSLWLAREAKEGLWGDHRVHVIPYGVPLDVHVPVDRHVARRSLGLDTSGPVILMAAEFLEDRRKGGHLLAQAMPRLSRRPITIITFGNGRLSLRVGDVHLRELGFVEDEQTKVLAYSAADVFVHPAPVDNLPNVVMESIACGTPVVAFAIGGLPDLVRPGITGWLCNAVSSEDLAVTLECALDEISSGADLRESCRMVAETEYCSSLQAKRYLDLFHALLKEGRHDRLVAEPGKGCQKTG
ncbi:MAG: glycosyltransferase, partial [Blastocatellia bacterium]